MKMPIEDYVDRHRRDMDVEEPEDQFIWEGIHRELSRGRRIRIHVMRYAVAIIILMTASYFIFSLATRKEEPATTITLADISGELASQENLFQLTIDRKLNEIKAYELEEEKYARFYKELEQLDELHQEYVADLQELGDNPRLIRAMLSYYELKIRILEKLLMEIEKQESHENKTEHEKQV
jgi:hypothetical protein